MVLPTAATTAAPLLPAVGAVAVNAAVLLVAPVVAPMLATLPVSLFAPQALRTCRVTVFFALV
ncbi:hypothetical protein D3C86_1643490 [compost metagenome]